MEQEKLAKKERDFETALQKNVELTMEKQITEQQKNDALKESEALRKELKEAKN